MKKNRKKARRVVLGVGSFGFADLGKSAQLWTKDNTRLRLMNMGNARMLDGVFVRLVAEVIE